MGPYWYTQVIRKWQMRIFVYQKVILGPPLCNAIFGLGKILVNEIMYWIFGICRFLYFCCTVLKPSLGEICVMKGGIEKELGKRDPLSPPMQLAYIPLNSLFYQDQGFWISLSLLPIVPTLAWFAHVDSDRIVIPPDCCFNRQGGLHKLQNLVFCTCNTIQKIIVCFSWGSGSLALLRS